MSKHSTFSFARIAFIGLPVAVCTGTIRAQVTETELAGTPREGGPGFDWTRTIHETTDAFVAIDPIEHPGLVGLTVDIYVTRDRDQADWDVDPVLIDVTANGPDALTVAAGSVVQNTVRVDPGTLTGGVPAGTPESSLGVGYDVVVDIDRDGLLDNGELIDGYAGGAGFFVARDTTLPGPHDVTSLTYTGGSFLGQELFYPTDVANLDDLPLVVVSHGNGHNYQWYDHIGDHLASYGYVVMSHQNNTQPGPNSASTTTLTNTDYLLGNLDIIAGGALDGKLDSSRMTWLGHSRGGEGVVRAYDRLVDGTYTPVYFTLDDITLISSIAPTDFLGTNSATPHDQDFHLWVGQADADVTGCVTSDVIQSFHLFGRATNQRQSISLNGVGHGDFHDGGGSSVASGPCLIGRELTHQIMLGHLLPLVEYHVRGNQAALDFLTRPYEEFAPRSVPEFWCIEANLQFRESAANGKLVLEDFQSAPNDDWSADVPPIETDLPEFFSGRLDDPNGNFTTSSPEDGMNGMSYSNAADSESGAVLAFPPGSDYFLRFNLNPPKSDWSGFRRLSFRMCQTTRNALTIAELGDVDFQVRLIDADGDSATLSTTTFSAGIVEPYQRTGCGTGTGWANEFETVRLPLRSFQLVEPALDLDRLRSLTFLFGSSHGAAGARLGLDDLELTTD